VRAAILFFALLEAVAAQSFWRNQVTFGGGWARQLNTPSYNAETATALEATYSYAVTPYIRLEAGVATALHPTPDVCGSFGCYQVDDRFLWAPFGVRFALPLWRRRLELSAGGGGLYEKYSVGNDTPFGFQSVDGWGGYFVGGAAVALDRRHRWWLGASPRWVLANPAEGRHDRWFLIPLEIGWRF